jgi:hypothetical protein
MLGISIQGATRRDGLLSGMIKITSFAQLPVARSNGREEGDAKVFFRTASAAAARYHWSLRMWMGDVV